MLTIRDLDPEVKNKLQLRAARHGRSMEAEVRHILTVAVETAEEPDLVSSLRRHFADAWVDLELPDRRQSRQRPVEFGS
jgi:plasmid stability protein